jgi:hypothetical protein
MSQSSTLVISMDIHQDSIAVASMAQNHDAEVSYLGAMGTRQGDIDQLVRKMPSKAKHLLSHSHDERALVALPWADSRVRLPLRGRKWFVAIATARAAASPNACPPGPPPGPAAAGSAPCRPRDRLGRHGRRASGAPEGPSATPERFAAPAPPAAYPRIPDAHDARRGRLRAAETPDLVLC